MATAIEEDVAQPEDLEVAGLEVALKTIDPQVTVAAAEAEGDRVIAPPGEIGINPMLNKNIVFIKGEEDNVDMEVVGVEIVG